MKTLHALPVEKNIVNIMSIYKFVPFVFCNNFMHAVNVGASVRNFSK